MSDTIDLLKKAFALECQLTEQEMTHSREMNWMKDMYTHEAKQREAAELNLGVLRDLFLAEKQKNASLEARVKLLEDEKTSTMNKKNQYNEEKGRLY